MNSKCLTCRKMLYRTDSCKGDGSVPCGRKDGGSKKSIAALTEVPSVARSRPVEPRPSVQTPIAGTQAPSVDTKPTAGERLIKSAKQAAEILRRPGRPKVHPDRKEYRKEWLRKDRRDHPEKYGKPAKGK